MFLDAELHVAYRILNTPILNFPFPHFYVENVFPHDFYSKIQENLLTEKEMTSRVIKAIENPNVTMIGHLTGRLLLSRKPYSINVPKVIDACASNHTHIEINANPRRLDMDWRWWRQAKDKGVKCSINPDAHRIEHFQFLHFGVKIAQKGWLESNDIINCLPLNEIESTLNKKQNL